MISVPAITVERIAATLGRGESLPELAETCVSEFAGRDDIGSVIVATFSNPDRFPALSVKLASSLGLESSAPAFDLQLACSAYPYALYLAGRLAADTGKKALVVNGDVQSRLVDRSDRATGEIFSDACTASLVSCDPASAERSCFDFLSRHDEALACGAAGPIRMDGFKVFSFVATEVSAFLREFLAQLANRSAATPLAAPKLCEGGADFFVPHQANPYMVRQLAKSLGLEDRLLVLPEEIRNPGSCSIPLTLAQNRAKGRCLVAGFGAGYSASVGLVNVL